MERRRVSMTVMAAVLALAAAFPLAAGGGKEKAPAASSAAADPASLKGELKVWTAFGADQGMGDMVAAFNREYPDIKVTLSKYSNTSDGNIGVDTTLMAGGEIDVLLNFGAAKTQERALAGLFLDLTDLCTKEKIDLVKEFGSEYRFNDRIYTLPMGGLSYYVAINMDSWKEAGYGALPKEWTWDEYIEACRKMTKTVNGKRMYGGSDYHTIDYFTYPARQVEGADVYYGKDGLSNFDNPIIRKSLAMKYQCEVTEKIWFPLVEYRSNSLQSQMVILNGTVASTVITNLTRFVRDRKNYPISFKVGFAPYPVMEKGQKNYLSGVPTFSHLGITANTKNKDAAWAFEKWFATKGGVYLTIAGHMPTWSGTNMAGAVDLIFGSEKAASELIDVESFKRVVFNYAGPAYKETRFTAVSDIGAVVNDVTMRYMNGKIDLDAAMKEMKERSDAAIKKAK